MSDKIMLVSEFGKGMLLHGNGTFSGTPELRSVC
jgi:hypothetical protein